jgi:hypothetical protein
MAKAQQTPAPAPEPVPGIRTALAALVPDAAHVATAAYRGHDTAHLTRVIDGHLLDALAGLRQLESTASGDGAKEIRTLIERLA